MTQSDNNPDLDLIARQIENFRNGFQTLLLSTVDVEGRPDASYAPYIESDGSFYLFISELATHTQNLQKQPAASVMFIENEEIADHPFARKRLTYRCKAEFIDKAQKEYGSLLEKMTNTFGALMNTLRSLSDFHLVKLTPLSGNYVAGFGKAFQIDVQPDAKLSSKLTHVVPGKAD